MIVLAVEEEVDRELDEEREDELEEGLDEGLERGAGGGVEAGPDGEAGVGGLPGVQEGGFQYPALDELPGLQGVVSLLHQIVPDVLFPDDDHRVDGVGQGPQLGPLF